MRRNSEVAWARARVPTAPSSVTARFSLYFLFSFFFSFITPAGDARLPTPQSHMASVCRTHVGVGAPAARKVRFCVRALTERETERRGRRRGGGPPPTGRQCASRRKGQGARPGPTAARPHECRARAGWIVDDRALAAGCVGEAFRARHGRFEALRDGEGRPTVSTTRRLRSLARALATLVVCARPPPARGQSPPAAAGGRGRPFFRRSTGRTVSLLRAAGGGAWTACAVGLGRGADGPPLTAAGLSAPRLSLRRATPPLSTNHPSPLSHPTPPPTKQNTHTPPGRAPVRPAGRGVPAPAPGRPRPAGAGAPGGRGGTVRARAAPRPPVARARAGGRGRRRRRARAVP
jgi:hypothetical protein